MKKVIQSALFLIMIFITSTVWAGDITEGSLDKLMALSGLNKQTAETTGMLRAQMKHVWPKGSPITDKQLGEWRNIVKSAFQPSDFLSTIGIELKNNISELEAKELLAWYTSDLGRTITKAEENASTPAAYQEMNNEAQSLLANEKRVNLAKKIDHFSNITNILMRHSEKTGIALFTILSQINKPDEAVDIESFKAKMSAQQQQLRANIEQSVILSLVYSYKYINIDSMEKYINFLERPTTRKFIDSAMNGNMYALNQSFDDMAKSLTAVFKNHDQNVNR